MTSWWCQHEGTISTNIKNRHKEKIDMINGNIIIHP
jgi:hypothetical protein